MKPVAEVLARAPVARGVRADRRSRRASSTGSSTSRRCSRSGAGSTCRSATRRGCGRTGTTTSCWPRTTRGSGWRTSRRSTVVRERREDVLDDGDERYLDERASVAGTSAHLGSAIDRPLLAGHAARPLPLLHGPYLADRQHARDRRADPPRVALHGGASRRVATRDLSAATAALAVPSTSSACSRSSNTRQYGVQIYGAPREPKFLNASSLYQPDTSTVAAP